MSDKLADLIELVRPVNEKKARRLAFGDSGKVDDLIQAANIAIWRNQDKVTAMPEDRHRPFLYTVCRNAMVDLLREESHIKRKDENRLIINYGSYGDVEGESADPFYTFYSRSVLRALDKLPPRLRQVAHMLGRGDTPNEIAEVLGVSPSAVCIMRAKIKDVILRWA